MKKIEFFRHNLEEKDFKNAREALEGIFLSTGEWTKDFEGRFAQYLGIPHVVGVTSCTAALHLSLLASNIGKGDEVITTPMSFVATSHVIEHTGARPVFVDVEKETGNIDVGKIEAAITERTKAILPVHLYGQLCDMRTIRAIADKHGLSVIEDAAHAIESERDGYRSGELGDFACFSFYATKSITSGEGGAISVHTLKKAELLRKLRLHGMSSGAADRYTKLYRHYDVEMEGWKYNMDNIQASLLLHQLENIEERLRRREEICQRYEQAFSACPHIRLLRVLPGSKSARCLFTILVPPDRRDESMQAIQNKGVGIAINFRTIHLMKYYRDKYGYKAGDFPVAEDIGASTITLPLYPKLTDEEIDYVIQSVVDVVQRNEQ